MTLSCVLALCLACLPSAPRARAASLCVGTLGRDEVVRCALSRSLDLALARMELRKIAGRRISAGTWLPSHPVATLAVMERRPPFPPPAGTAPTINWYLTLTQEIEIAGQRGARLDVVDAEAAAQLRRVAVAEQEAAAAALVAYHDLLEARAQLRLARDLGEIAAALRDLAVGRAREGLAAPVEADVAQAEAARIDLSRLEAARREEAARAALSFLLDLDPLPEIAPVDDDEEVEAALPLPGADARPEVLLEQGLLLRGEIAAAEMEQRMRLQRVRLLRRERVPNLGLSFSAQRDGFDERVLGGALSLPLFLPAPLGPSRAGEIAESQVEAERAATALERVRRRVRLEIIQALADLRTRDAEVRLFPPELVARARADLRALAGALSARQMSLREALLAERSLIEMLQADARARLNLKRARVELMRAAGLPLAPDPTGPAGAR